MMMLRFHGLRSAAARPSLHPWLDVLETVLGVEIVDETDSVEDMQKLARQLVKSRRRSGA